MAAAKNQYNKLRKNAFKLLNRLDDTHITSRSRNAIKRHIDTVKDGRQMTVYHKIVNALERKADNKIKKKLTWAEVIKPPREELVELTYQVWVPDRDFVAVTDKRELGKLIDNLEFVSEEEGAGATTRSKTNSLPKKKAPAKAPQKKTPKGKKQKRAVTREFEGIDPLVWRRLSDTKLSKIILEKRLAEELEIDPVSINYPEGQTINGLMSSNDMVRALDENEIDVTFLRSCIQSGMIIIEWLLQRDMPNAGDYDPREQFMYSASAPKLYTRFIENAIDWNSLFKDEKIDTENQGYCVPDLLLDVYREGFAKSGRYDDLTHEMIWEAFYPTEKFDKERLKGVSLEIMMNFFKKYRLRLVAFDRHMDLIDFYEPEEMNHNIAPSTLYIMVHNTHCYRLNRDIGCLQAWMADSSSDTDITDADELIVKPHYPLLGMEKDAFFVHDIAELSVIQTEQEKGYFTVYYTGNLNQVVQKMLTNGYYPMFKHRHGIATDVRIEVGEKIFRVVNAGYFEDEAERSFPSVNYYKTFVRFQDDIKNTILNKNTLSRYSKSLKTMMTLFSCHPTCCAMVDMIPPDRTAVPCNAYDFNKAYTSNILGMFAGIPVFNTFDEFVPYTGQIIDANSLYFVEYHGEEYKYPCLITTKYNLMTGYSLGSYRKLLANDITIIAVCTPSKVVPFSDRIHALIRELYSSELIESDRKFCVNEVIGCTGKKLNKSYRNKVYTDYTEAYRDYELYGGQISTFDTSENEIEMTETEVAALSREEKLKYYNIDKEGYYKTPVVYILTQVAEAELVDGFLPIQIFIYDLMRVKMQKLYSTIVNAGGTVLGVKTDCIYYLGNVNLRVCPDSLDDFNKIGGLKKLEATEYYCNKQVTFKKNIKEYEEMMAFIVPIVKPDVFSVVNEFSTPEINKRIGLKNNDPLLITSSVAGGGKTTCVKNFADAIGRDKLLFVCPYNTLALDIRSSGYNAITLFQLIGIIFDGEEHTRQNAKQFDISQFECIAFDEIYCHTVSSLGHISNFMNNNPNIKFLATGDPLQNEPIEHLSVKNKSEYYSNIIHKLFPRVLDLQMPKRVKGKKDIEKIFEIKRDIFNEDLKLEYVMKKHFKIIKSAAQAKGFFIAYFNDTSCLLNVMKHKEKHPDADTGVTVNGINYHVGDELVARCFHKMGKHKIQINYVYKITKINKKGLTIHEPLEQIDFNIPLDMLAKFTLNYCRTGHSTQGLTIDNEITIFDVNNPRITRKWLWTAVTRATKLDNVYICLNKINQEETDLVGFISTMIKSDKSMDKRAGRTFSDEEYIDFNYMKDMIFEQNFCCANCSTTLTIKHGMPWTASINRLDNELPHIKGNVNFVCIHCNKSIK
ncbi:TPA_asm: PolB-S1H [Capsaspora MELD virus 1]|nr:TPA_asm: PolB-S1H [Capsaspora MELD virus 1]